MPRSHHAITLTAILTAFALTDCSSASSRQIPSLVPARVTNATDVGPMSPNETVRLVIGLELHDRELMQTTLAAVRRGNIAHLTAAEFGDRFAVDRETYAHVESWAKQAGLTIVRRNESRATLVVEGKIADIEASLHTTMHHYVDRFGVFYSITRQPTLPAAVSSVVGLSNANPWWSNTKMVALVDGPPSNANGYTLTDLKNLYSLPTSGTIPTGSGAQVAILGVGAPNATADVGADPGGFHYDTPQTADIAQYLGVASTPGGYSQTQVGVSTAAQAGDANTAYSNTLDAEIVVGIAPAATVHHVFAVTAAPGAMTDGIDFIVNDPSQASVAAVDVSFASCEAKAASDIPVLEGLFAQALAQGQQWFAATGNSGTDACGDGVNLSVHTVAYPASSPYVIAVGGTQVNNTGTKKNPIYTGAAWGGTITNQGQQVYEGAGGGGPSSLFTKPSWQVGTTTTDGARDLPDVSAMAGPPYLDAIFGGADMSMQGTSAASASWVGIWALLVGENGGTAFNQAPIDLYNHAPAGAFVDITAGTNTTGQGGTAQAIGYASKAGYDLATGLGTPNITNLLKQTGWK
jgi:kumamolisin